MGRVRFTRNHGTYTRGDTADLDNADSLIAAGVARPDEPPAGNASTEDWRDYARRHGINVDDDATRDDIRQAVEKEGN